MFLFEDKGRALFAEKVPWATVDQCAAYLRGAEFHIGNYLRVHFMQRDKGVIKPRQDRMFDAVEKAEKTLEELRSRLIKVVGVDSYGLPHLRHDRPESVLLLDVETLMTKLHQVKALKPGRRRRPEVNKRYLVDRLRFAYRVTFGAQSRKLDKVLLATRAAYECSRTRQSSQDIPELPSLPELHGDLLKVKKPPK